MYLPKGFFGDLELELIGLVNGKISDKMRLENPTLREYAHKRSEIEMELILKGIEWYSFYEGCTFLRDATVEDAHFLETLSDYYLLKLLVVVGKGLRAYINNYQEENPNCKMLYGYYFLLKKEIEVRPNLDSVPKGDGFFDYLNSREDRKKLLDKKENARKTGEMCIHCESKNVRSNGNMFTCIDCHRSFRKRK